MGEQTVAAVILIAAGAAVVVMALLGRAGRLPRNYVVGIRLPSTLRSDEAWMAAHRASWPYSAISGVLMFVLGIMFLVGDAPPTQWLILSVVLVPLLIGTVVARSAAKRAPDEREHPKYDNWRRGWEDVS